jgi:hypothetical protein
MVVNLSLFVVNLSLNARQSLPLSDVKPLPAVAYHHRKSVKRGKLKKIAAHNFFVVNPSLYHLQPVPTSDTKPLSSVAYSHRESVKQESTLEATKLMAYQTSDMAKLRIVNTDQF